MEMVLSQSDRAEMLSQMSPETRADYLRSKRLAATHTVNAQEAARQMEIASEQRPISYPIKFTCERCGFTVEIDKPLTKEKADAAFSAFKYHPNCLVSE